MFRHNRAFLALCLVVVFLAGASLAFAQNAPAAQSPTKWVTLVRGTADIQYTKPVSKRDKGDAVTVIVAKNTSPLAIGRLTVEEFWYDKAGETVGGGKDTCRKPLAPGETYTFTLRFPWDAKMNANKYVFSHANGQVKATAVSKF